MHNSDQSKNDNQRDGTRQILETILESVPAWKDDLPENSTWTTPDEAETDLDSEY